MPKTLREAAREEGYQAGYAHGLADGKRIRIETSKVTDGGRLYIPSSSVEKAGWYIGDLIDVYTTEDLIILKKHKSVLS